MAKTSKNAKSSDLWTLILFTLLLITGLVLVGLGVIVARESDMFVVLAIGILAVTIPAAIYPVIMRLNAGGDFKTLELLNSIDEKLLLSDDAKRYASMTSLRDALHTAIFADIEANNYDAAMMLVTEMTERFGLREEAEKYREQIDNARALHREATIEKAISEISTMCMEYKWDKAMSMVNRLQRLYPDHIRIAALPQHVEKSRENHKRDLERAFLTAAEIDDVEKATELMKELDKYLTADEAEPFIETARGVIGKKRENLGVQFKLSVHDRDWINAMRLGETIIQEFPNTKMADEVRGMLDLLRQRAAGQRAAEGGS